MDAAELETVLRALRERLGVTQKEIADRAGISPAMIARLESGDRRPSREVLSLLAAVFATTPDGLVQAAHDVAARHPVDQVLDALPADLPAATDLAIPAETAGHYAPPPAGQAPAAASPAASSPTAQPETRAQRQARLAFETLTDLPDPDAATTLLREVAGWLAASPDRDLALVRRDLETTLAHVARRGEPVAAMPTGQVRYLFVRALGYDEHGQAWIDPLAQARISGDDDHDPRVERYDDGRIVIDISRLTDTTIGQRDERRHRTRVIIEQHAADPGPDDPALYTNVVLDIHTAADTTIGVTPEPAGTIHGALPDGMASLCVLTAANPRQRLLRPAENTERNRLLTADLDSFGLDHLPATIRSRDRSWSEPGHAVIDADADRILDLARRYEQTAIFHWTPKRLQVIWTQPDQPALATGWSRHD